MKNLVNKFALFSKHEYLRIIALLFIFVFAFMPLITLMFNISGNDLSYIYLKIVHFGKVLEIL